MDIDIKDYLSDSEMRIIVEEEFREKIRKYFNTESDIARIITNLGYYNTFKIIEDEVPNFKDLIKQKTKEQCEKISSYAVFREKSDYERQNSLAQDYLEEAVEENKDLINRKVLDIINGLNKQDIAFEINSIIEEKIDNLFKGE